MEAFFTLLGTELHTFGPISHFPEQVQFPKETVLNHDCVIYTYFAGCLNRVLMYVGHMLFLTLYMRIAMCCSRR